MANTFCSFKLVAVGLSLILSACNFEKTEKGIEVQINGQIEGLTVDSVFIDDPYVANFRMDPVKVQDDGSFTYKRAVPYPDVLTVYLNRDYDTFFRVFVEDGEIDVTGRVDSLQKVKVRGSRVHNEYVAYRSGQTQLGDSLNVLDQKVNEASRLGKLDTADSLSEIYATLARKKMERIIAYAKVHPSSWLIPYFVERAVGDDPNSHNIDLALQGSPESIRNSQRIKNARTIVQQVNLVSIGSPAPDFQAADAEGKQIKLADLKGKVVLLDFWAQWCAPCRANHPDLVELYKRYATEHFALISISIDKEKDGEAWRRAVKKDQLTWTQICELKGPDGPIAAKYGIAFIPASFLIDANGIVVAKDIHRKKLRKELDRLLKHG